MHRRLIGSLLLLTILAESLGMPVPMRVIKDGGLPFPCQHHACGCLTAAQCWGSCCCYTNQQQLQWAAHNHIKPPVQVRVAAKEGCAEKSCCAAHRHEKSRPQPTLALSLVRLRCGGSATFWSILSQAAPLPRPTAVSLSRCVVVYLRLASEHPVAVPLTPPVPPPEPLRSPV